MSFTFTFVYVEMLDVKNHPNSHPNSHPSSTDAKWIKLPDLPANRTEMAVVYVQGRIYVIGGAGTGLNSRNGGNRLSSLSGMNANGGGSDLRGTGFDLEGNYTMGTIRSD